MTDLHEIELGEPGNHSTRLSAPAITCEKLEQIWPQVARRLGRMLYLRGLDKSQADDLVQEVAVRALAVGISFFSAEDFYAWAAPVARNLHIDLVRARAKTADSSALPAIAATTNVEHEVERRLVLEHVLAALATMGDADRSAILDRLNDDTPTDAGEAGKIAVRRHRARQRLRLMVKGALGWAGIGAALRKLRPLTAPNLAPVALAAPALFVAVMPGVFGVHVPESRDLVRVDPGRAATTAAAYADTTAAEAAALRAQAASTVGATSARTADAGDDRKPRKRTPVGVPGFDDIATVEDHDNEDGYTLCFVTPADKVRRCYLRTLRRPPEPTIDSPARISPEILPAAASVGSGD